MVKNKLHNIIYLECWNDQPLHCPFCGRVSTIDDDSKNCKHWLYTVSLGIFYRSRRYNTLVGLPDAEDIDVQMTLDEKEKYGDPYEIIAKNYEELVNLIEFQIDEIGDISYTGFAPYQEELVYWGHDHVSVYEK